MGQSLKVQPLFGWSGLRSLSCNVCTSKLHIIWSFLWRTRCGIATAIRRNDISKLCCDAVKLHSWRQGPLRLAPLEQAGPPLSNSLRDQTWRCLPPVSYTLLQREGWPLLNISILWPLIRPVLADGGRLRGHFFSSPLISHSTHLEHAFRSPTASLGSRAEIANRIVSPGRFFLLSVQAPLLVRLLLLVL